MNVINAVPITKAAFFNESRNCCLLPAIAATVGLTAVEAEGPATSVILEFQDKISVAKSPNSDQLR